MSAAHPIAAYVRPFGKPRVTAHIRAAATYARKSRALQQSIPEQQELTRRYAVDRLGLPVVAVLSDAMTGLRADRPDYQELLRLARGGRISHIVLFKDDRLGRDDVEFIQAMREFEKLGIEVHDVSSGKIEPDMVGLKAWLANREVRTISARVLPLMRQRVAKGQALQRPPLGYMPHRDRDMKGVFVPSPEAPAVTEMFHRYAAGENLTAVAAWLSMATGTRKTRTVVKQLLQNPFFTGTLVWGRESQSKITGRHACDRSEWVFGKHEYPLIDEATWLTCQARLATNQNVGQERTAGAVYSLSGLVRCAACRHPRPDGTPGDRQRVFGRPANNGTTATYYCPGCGKTRSTTKVEHAVRHLVEAIPLGVDAIAAVDYQESDTATQAQERTAEVSAAIERLHTRRQKLTLGWADGTVSPSDYSAAITATDAELTALHGQLDDVGQHQTDQAGLERMRAWLARQESWTALLDVAKATERNAVYREAISMVALDYSSNTISLTWTPSIARLVCQERATATL